MSEDKSRPPTPEEIAKTKKETEKLEVEIEQLKVSISKDRATAANSELEAEKIKAEADKLRAEARAAAAMADVAQIGRDQVKREEDEHLAKDRFHHRYVLDEIVRSGAVNNCISQLTTWTRQTEKCEIELVLNSPGGDIISGFALIDFITGLQADGHTINTKALGYAASMAGVILQVGDTRTMGKHSVLLIHEASFAAMGGYGEVKDQIKLVDMMHERILDLFTTRSNVTRAFIKRHWDRTDWWIGATDALKHGFVDAIE